MNDGLYLAMNGAKYNVYAQSVHANNLANASTTGFKADFATALSRAVTGDGRFERGSIPVALVSNTDFSPGALQETGEDFDVAVQGDGFIAVRTEDGEEAYTRAGSLRIDDLGFLRNERGDQVLGTGGAIVVPEAETVEIGSDGVVSIRALGQTPAALQGVERIRLVNPPLQELSKGEDGRFYAGDFIVVADADVRLQNGFVEASNVNPVHEITSITGLARQFEMNIRMMQTIGDMAQTTARILQVQA